MAFSNTTLIKLDLSESINHNTYWRWSEVERNHGIAPHPTSWKPVMLSLHLFRL